MREAGDALMPQTMTLSGGSRRFFNQGTNGRWRDVLTSDDLALYDAKVREKLTPGLARWIEGGQRAVGDPRMTKD
jgi:aryl sulfotransferase